MVTVEPGQYVVAQTRHGYRVAKADQVTPRQVRTKSAWDSYEITDRHNVLFAGTGKEAGRVHAALNLAKIRHEERCLAAESAFLEATAPFRETRATARSESGKTFRSEALAIIESKGTSNLCPPD